MGLKRNNYRNVYRSRDKEAPVRRARKEDDKTGREPSNVTSKQHQLSTLKQPLWSSWNGRECAGSLRLQLVKRLVLAGSIERIVSGARPAHCYVGSNSSKKNYPFIPEGVEQTALGTGLGALYLVTKSMTRVRLLLPGETRVKCGPGDGMAARSLGLESAPSFCARLERGCESLAAIELKYTRRGIGLQVWIMHRTNSLW